MKVLIDISETEYKRYKFKSFETITFAEDAIANGIVIQEGEWILKETDCDDGGNNRYECSKCHYTDVHADSAEVPYCWHCGSIMKGGAK